MKDKKKTKTIPRQVRWDKLDNTAHLFPSIAGGEYDKRVPDQCDLKRRGSGGISAAGAGHDSAEIRWV